jgi:hypothetical protein
MNASKMIVAIAAGVALTACGQSGAGKSAGPVSVSAVAAPASGSSSGSSSGSTSESSSGSTSSAPGQGAAPAAPSSALPPGLVLTGLSVAVRELELDGGVCATTAVAAPVARSSAGDHDPAHVGSRDGAHDPSHVGSRDGSHDPSQVGSRDGAHDPSHVGSRDGSCESDDDHSRDGSHEGSRDGEHRECEAELGPFVARLDPAALGSLTAGSLSQIWAATAPAGSYSKLEAKLCGIDPATLKDPAQAALAKAMNGASVVLEGTYQAPGSESAPVPFRIAVNACAELERRVNVTVDASGAVSNLTLNIPVAAWFRDAKGNALAPDTAAGAAAIAANIAGSLDLYGDDDHDGRDDDERRSGK